MCHYNSKYLQQIWKYGSATIRVLEKLKENGKIRVVSAQMDLLLRWDSQILTGSPLSFSTDTKVGLYLKGDSRIEANSRICQIVFGK